VAADVYAWSWPARLSGDDPYEWRGPVERPAADLAEPVLASAMVEPEVNSTPLALAETVSAPPVAFSETEEVWVELDAPEPKPARARRSRGRGRGAKYGPTEIAVDSATPIIGEMPIDGPEQMAAESPAPAPVVEPEPVAVEQQPEPAPVHQEITPVAELTPEPVIVAPAPMAKPIIDPSEISAPAAAPKRGWWRGRG